VNEPKVVESFADTNGNLATGQKQPDELCRARLFLERGSLAVIVRLFHGDAAAATVSSRSARSRLKAALQVMGKTFA